MTHEEHPNVALVRQGFEAFDRGDMSWMDQHMSDDIVWHVGGNSKWAGSYRGKEAVLDLFARQTQAMGGMPPRTDVHDILGNDQHVVVLGNAKATAADGSNAGWQFVQVFHIAGGRATEVWGLADNDAAVDPFLDALG